MPHQLLDSLLPGETLEFGESLVSNDGRFKLTLERGRLALYAFTVHLGRYAMFGRVLPTGPNSRLRFPNRGGCLFVDAIGGTRTFMEARFRNLDNHRFVIQDDGNLVHYGTHPNGTIVALGASDTNPDVIFGGSKSVAPNTKTVEVVSGGQLILDTRPTDGDIVNLSGQQVGVRDGTNYVNLPDQGSVPVAQAGVVQIEIPEYQFEEPPAGNSTRFSRNLDSADAIGVTRGPHGRFRVEIVSGFQLRLNSRSKKMQGAEGEGVLVRDLLKYEDKTDD